MKECFLIKIDATKKEWKKIKLNRFNLFVEEQKRRGIEYENVISWDKKKKWRRKEGEK